MGIDRGTGGLIVARASSRRSSSASFDRFVDDVVRRRCAGVPIDIMKIRFVFEAGRAALAAGGDLAAIEAAIVAKYHECAGVPVPAGRA